MSYAPSADEERRAAELERAGIWDSGVERAPEQVVEWRPVGLPNRKECEDVSYHDSHPVHYAATVGEPDDQEQLAFKREGDTILVYPGPFRLTLSEWASAVAFTTIDGESGPTHAAVLDLLGQS